MTSHRHLLSTTIKTLADRLGVTQRTIRLYEEHGLVTAQRNDRNVRIYDPEQVTRLAMVVALRQLGVGLTEIARFSRLPAQDVNQTIRKRLSTLRESKRSELAALDLVLNDLNKGAGLSPTLEGLLAVQRAQDKTTPV